MLRQRRIFALAAVVAGLLAGSAVLPAYAQDATQAPAADVPTAGAPAAPAASTQPEPSAERLALAIQFLKVSGLTTGFDDIIPQFMTQASQIYASRRPELRGMINDAAISLIPEFVKKRDDLDKALARFYTTKFNDDELKQLVTFYQTPVGAKFSKEQQNILRDSVPVVGNWTRDLQDSIMLRLRQEVQKRGGQLGGPDDGATAQGNAPTAPGSTPPAGNGQAPAQNP
ncbi:hypothetical protein GCM10007874_51340 [Labrys miyagiensis]|uniref:DUF2059 domain-containing protein n=1 Tax=Labrys miyagiensis TaxID=346912 RepID=A0ABQ6CR96_9HYPH|nr:DUF2059 domain-containing protein [Labrys miyagiensis]GLS22117.1 hypothetical protein GCM10007874_51340 [Labrys miyagiensis]